MLTGGIPPGVTLMPNQHKYRLMRPHSTLLDRLPGAYPESVSVALSRYLYLVSEPPLFSDAEWNLLRDVCNGWYTQSTPASVVLQELAFVVEDALQLRALDQHWE